MPSLWLSTPVAGFAHMNLLLPLRLPSHFSENMKVSCTESFKCAFAWTNFFNRKTPWESQVESCKNGAVHVACHCYFNQREFRPALGHDTCKTLGSRVSNFIATTIIWVRPHSALWSTHGLHSHHKCTQNGCYSVNNNWTLHCNMVPGDAESNEQVSQISLTLQAVYICAYLTDIIIAGMWAADSRALDRCPS